MNLLTLRVRKKCNRNGFFSDLGLNASNFRSGMKKFLRKKRKLDSIAFIQQVIYLFTPTDNY